MSPRSTRLAPLLLCAVVGAAGGLVLMPAVGASLLTGSVLGIAYGLLSRCCFRILRCVRARDSSWDSGMHCFCGSPQSPVRWCCVRTLRRRADFKPIRIAFLTWSDTYYASALHWVSCSGYTARRAAAPSEAFGYRPTPS